MSEAEKIAPGNEDGKSSTQSTDNVVHFDPGKKAGEGKEAKSKTAWKTKLIKKKAVVAYRPNVANALHALREAPEWKGSLRLNEFSERVILDRAPPWHKAAETWIAREWTNNDTIALVEWLQRQDIDVSKNTVGDAILGAAAERKFHPVRDWLNSLAWDGVPRLDTWLHRYMRTQDGFYERIVGAKWLISGVARVMKPGCKADCMLIFIGDQGQGKSTALVILAGEEWFTDELCGGLSGDKNTAIAMAGKWIVEFAELEQFEGKSSEELKAFISRTKNRYRGLFERFAEDHPRQTIFGGTTNQTTPLKDITGHRRFWPALVGKADLGALAADRNQLWAEAVHRYNQGELWWLDTEEEKKAHEEMAQSAQEIDAWQDIIGEWLKEKTSVTMVDALVQALGIKEENITKSTQMRVAKAFHGLGWGRVHKRVGKERHWAYEKK